MVVSVVRAPSAAGFQAGAGGEDVRARRYQIWFDAAIGHWPAAAERGYVLAAVRRGIVTSRIFPKVIKPEFPPRVLSITAADPFIFRGANGNDILGGSRRGNRVEVNVAVTTAIKTLAIRASVAGGNEDGEVLVCGDEVVKLAGLIVVFAVISAAPAFVLHAHASYRPAGTWEPC